MQTVAHADDASFYPTRAPTAIDRRQRREPAGPNGYGSGSSPGPLRNAVTRLQLSGCASPPDSILPQTVPGNPGQHGYCERVLQRTRRGVERVTSRILGRKRLDRTSRPPIANGFDRHDRIEFETLTDSSRIDLQYAVPVCTVAPFHNSVGDQSTAEVTQMWLTRLGAPSYLTSFWNCEETATPTVIGGGDLLGRPLAGPWASIKPAFLPRGPNLTNAVGIDLATFDDDCAEVMQDYRYISVRDRESVELLSDKGLSASATPCPATLQDGPEFKVLLSLPRLGALSELKEKGYYVLHKHPRLEQVANDLRRSKTPFVVVDMQGHAEHSWYGGGIVLDSVHSPSVIRSLVASSAGVFTVSLHLAVFAVGAGVPFAVSRGDSYQADKTLRYLRRAGFKGALSRQPKCSLSSVRERTRSFLLRVRLRGAAQLNTSSSWPDSSAA